MKIAVQINQKRISKTDKKKKINIEILLPKKK